MRVNKNRLHINTDKWKDVTDNGERRWYIIQHFIDWFTSDDVERDELHTSLQLYIQQEIYKETEDE